MNEDSQLFSIFQTCFLNYTVLTATMSFVNMLKVFNDFFLSIELLLLHHFHFVAYQCGDYLAKMIKLDYSQRSSLLAILCSWYANNSEWQCSHIIFHLFQIYGKYTEKYTERAEVKYVTPVLILSVFIFLWFQITQAVRVIRQWIQLT